MAVNPISGQSEVMDPVARVLLSQAMQDRPMYHWADALGRLAQFGVGAFAEQSRRDQNEKEMQDWIKATPGLGDATPAATTPTVPAGPRPATTPTAAAAAPAAPETWHSQQNNPGNIRQTAESLKAYPGAQPGERGFLKFGTPEQGAAAIAQTFRYIAKTTGDNTLLGIISRYAPKGDGANDPAAYAAAVAKETGFDPRAPLDVNDPAVMAKIIPAVIRVETGAAPSQRFAPDQQVAQATPAPGTPRTMTDLTRQPGAIPPEMAAHIRAGLASKNPQVRAAAMGLYQQYAAPDKPTDERRNYVDYVRQETAAGRPVKSMYEWMIDMKRAGAPPTAERAFEVETSKAAADRLKGLNESVGLGMQRLPSLDRMSRLLDAVRTGPFAAQQLTWSRVGQTLGIDLGRYGLDPDKIANAEELQSLMTRELTSIAKILGANPTNYDAELLQKQVVNFEKTGQGNKQIIETARRAIHFDRVYLREAEIWAKKNSNLLGFNEYFADKYKDGVPMPGGTRTAPPGEAPPPEAAPPTQPAGPQQGRAPQRDAQGRAWAQDATGRKYYEQGGKWFNDDGSPFVQPGAR